MLPLPSLSERRRYCVAGRPSVTPSRCVCVCVRRISLGGEGNARYPVLASCCFDALFTVAMAARLSNRVANFVELSFESSFELLEFLLDEIFGDKIYRLICSTVLAGISTR